MAVFTALDGAALEHWLDAHEIGALVAMRGIATGIENTNFFVTTEAHGKKRDFVLTLFERLTTSELPFYLELMRHLSAHGVPCPAPVADRNGALFSALAGKPAALVTRLAGRSALAPGTAHCALIGGALARLHRQGLVFPLRQDNPRGLAWRQAAASRVRGHLDTEQRALLDGEVAHQATLWPEAVAHLPTGAIHADLFRDNALFVKSGPPSSVDDADSDSDSNRAGLAPLRLGGIIDFYFAGTDAWLFDVAVSANDWCVDLASGAFDAARLEVLLAAYATVRPFCAAEADAWPLALRAAALRFWLSRLDDLHRPRHAEMLTPHDPAHFERILMRRREDDASGALELPDAVRPARA